VASAFRNSMTVALVALTIAANPATPSAQVTTPQQWHAYVTSLPARPMVDVRLSSGRKFRGRLLDVDDEGMSVAVTRAFRRAREERVLFADVERITHAHPTREALRATAVSVPVVILLFAWILSAAG
jgi:hypothetical protein